jgi:excisionase family DNA binding protein
VIDRLAYRPREVASLLGVPVVRVQRWLLSGELKGNKIGAMWFVYAEDLEARLRGYDDVDARSQRREPVPPKPGRSLGSDGDDGGRTPAVEVGPVEGGRRSPAAGTHQAAGRSDTSRSYAASAWSLPREVAR